MMAHASTEPNIRFSSFKEPWELKSMRQLLELTIRPIQMKDDNDYSLITVRRGNRGVDCRGIYKGRKVLVKSQFEVLEGDFVISKRQIVHQACGIVPSELNGSIVSNEYNVFQPTKECSLPYFNYYSYRPQMRHAFFLSSVGVHLEKMLFKTQDWLKRQFYFPSLPEQEKIAAFLTSVDDRIDQLKRKKSLLQDYKKGAMQKLFTQELRFKDEQGKDFPDWEEMKLGEISSFLKDGSHGTHPNDETSEYRLLSGKNIKDGKIRIDDDDRRISESEYSSICKNYTLDHGDILLTIVGTIGRVAIFRSEKKIAFQRSVAFLRFVDEIPQFIYHQFCHEAFQRQLKRRSVSSAQAGIYLGDIAKIPILIPTKGEQTKIANFLSSLDQKIEQIDTQITQTQTFKKGLLQQMFV